MIVRRVEMECFTVHDHTATDLPDTGVVLITGPNGSGKSSMIEAVAHGVFGKNLRGDWGWQDPDDKKRGFTSLVRVETDRVHVERSKGRTSPKLVWNRPGGIPTEYDTTGKAQEGLEAIIGTFDLWVRSHVFSSGNAKRFTLAGDADRKRLLESMLAVSYYDDGAALAKADLSARTNTLNALEGDRQRQESRIAVEEGKRTVALTALEQPEPVFAALVEPAPLKMHEMAPYPPEPEEIEALPDYTPGVPDPKVQALRADIVTIDGHLTSITNDLGRDRRLYHHQLGLCASAEQRQKEAEKLLDKWPGGMCPTCKQDVPEDLLQPLIAQSELMATSATADFQSADVEAGCISLTVEDLEEEQVTLQARRDLLAVQVTEHDAELSALSTGRGTAERRHAAARSSRVTAIKAARTSHQQAHGSQMRALTSKHTHATQTYESTRAAQEQQLVDWKAAREPLNVTVRVADECLADAAVRLEEIAIKKVAAMRDVYLWQHIVAAMGIKGVRANVLGNALAGLQTLANIWLERIGVNGQQLQLREYSDKNKPQLALEVCTAKRKKWHTYSAASQGEQRRIDVALVLALAEVGRAARGLARGTLFMDEVLDNLDDEGVELVCAVISELAEDRCVVVISHNESLTTGLRPVLHLQAQDGAYVSC